MKISMTSWEKFKKFDPALIAGVHDVLSRQKEHSLSFLKK